MIRTLLAFALLFINKNSCSIHIYDNEKVTGFPDGIDFEPIYSNRDFHGGKKASIAYNLTFKGPEQTDVYFVLGSRKQIEAGVICIGNNLTKVSTEKSYNLRIESAKIQNGKAALEGMYKVLNTGLYSFFFMTCNEENDSNLSLEVDVSGRVALLNPFGYLPAHRYAYYDLYFIGMMVYTVFFFYWYILCFLNSANITKQHVAIGLTVIFTIVEMMLHDIETNIFNASGVKSHRLYLFAKFTLLIRVHLARICVALICNGIGIERKDTPKEVKRPIMWLSGTYFTARVLIELQRSVKINVTFTVFQLILSAVLTASNAAFYVWVAYSLTKTIKRLKQNETHKRALYKRLAIILMAGGMFSVAFKLLQIDYYRDKQWLKVNGWKMFWLYDTGLSEILFFYYLVTISYFLSPRNNFAEYMQLGQGENDLEKNIESESLSEALKKLDKAGSDKDEDYNSTSSEDKESGEDKKGSEDEAKKDEDAKPSKDDEKDVEKDEKDGKKDSSKDDDENDENEGKKDSSKDDDENDEKDGKKDSLKDDDENEGMKDSSKDSIKDSLKDEEKSKNSSEETAESKKESASDVGSDDIVEKGIVKIDADKETEQSKIVEKKAAVSKEKDNEKENVEKGKNSDEDNEDDLKNDLKND